jgi:DNA-binding beta-propeller fold protein YncE
MSRKLLVVTLGVQALLLALAPPPAGAARTLLTRTAVQTTFCRNCPPPSEIELLNPVPPPDGQIEGPCGLAIEPTTGGVYVSDYYHRRIDVYGLGGAYQSRLNLPGVNPVSGINSLDAVCGLAFSPGGQLYGNELHEGVVRLPQGETIDSGSSTGVAVDAAGNLFVNDRTYIAEYEAPIEAGEPDRKLAVGSLQEGYGLAVFEGRVYVADAADNEVKIYPAAGSQADPPADVIEGPEGEAFHSLRDTALAIDPNGGGHLLVIDDLKPGAEEPQSAVYEFDSSGAFLDRLAGVPIFGEPSGIAVNAASGRVFVTDGNSKRSNIFEYGPFEDGGFLVPSSGEAATSSSVTAPVRSAAPTATAASPPPSRRHGGSDAVIVRRGSAQVSFDGELTPYALPRQGRAPVGIAIDTQISGTNGGDPPQLRRIVIAMNRNGQLSAGGLPVCRERHIQPSTTDAARAACGGALVGEGHFAANVKLPEQSPFPSSGKVLAFNGRLHGKPAILAHIYGTQPAPTSYVLPFSIRQSRGTYGTVLETSLPHATGNWGYVTGLKMKLHRSFRYHGELHSYLSAGCPAPPGFPGAAFPLARTSFTFAGGMTLASTLNRSCRAKG